VIVRNERAGVAGDVEPGVIVEGESGEIGGHKPGRPEHGRHHRVEHELAQLLHTRLRPAEEVEATLERLPLGDVTRHGVSVLIILAGKEKRFELAVQTLARVEPRGAERHRKHRLQGECRIHHGGIQAPLAPTKRAPAVRRVSMPAARTMAIS